MAAGGPVSPSPLKPPLVIHAHPDQLASAKVAKVKVGASKSGEKLAVGVGTTGTTITPRQASCVGDSWTSYTNVVPTKRGTPPVAGTTAAANFDEVKTGSKRKSRGSGAKPAADTTPKVLQSIPPQVPYAHPTQPLCAGSAVPEDHCNSCGDELLPEHLEGHRCDNCTHRIHGWGKSQMPGSRCLIMQRPDDDRKLVCKLCVSTSATAKRPCFL